MRELKAKDIAPFTKILAKMELKETMKGMFKDSAEKGEMISALIWGIVENYHKSEKDFFKFLSELEGKSSDEIAELPLSEFIALITELFSDKNLFFFKLAAK